MTDWFETHAGLLQETWNILDKGVADARHPARRPTFATISPDGWPEARTLVLRASDQGAAMLSLHTDITSDKIKSLAKTARAALHVWDEGENLQIRIQADVIVETGASTRALWDKIPDHAQQSYGVTPPPGTPIENALDYVKEPDPATFAILHCRLAHIDVLYLGAQHRRASYSRARHWQGQWLSP